MREDQRPIFIVFVGEKPETVGGCFVGRLSLKFSWRSPRANANEDAVFGFSQDGENKQRASKIHGKIGVDARFLQAKIKEQSQWPV